MKPSKNLFLYIFLIGILSLSLVTAGLGLSDSTKPHLVVPTKSGTTNINNSYTNITNIFNNITQTGTSYNSSYDAGIKWQYNQTYSGSIYNVSYDGLIKWDYNQSQFIIDTYGKYFYNMTDGIGAGSYNSTYDKYAYNMTDGSYNSTYATWAYNQSQNIAGTYNSTYDNKNTSEWITNGIDIYNRNLGTVSIGTTSTDAKLTVVGATGAHAIKGTAGGVGQYGGLFYDSGAGNLALLGGNGWAGYFLGKGYFSDNVGIGTTNPYSIFQVGVSATYPHVDAPTAATLNSPTDSDSVLRISRNGLDYPEELLLGVNQTGAYSIIQAKQATAGGNRLALNPNGGNVGIGTTVPSSNLWVSDNNAGLIDGHNPTIVLGSNDNLAAGTIKAVEHSVGNSDLSFGVYDKADALYIQHGGNVGINTTSPTYPLDVEGNIGTGGNNNGMFVSDAFGLTQIRLNSINSYGTIQNDKTNTWSLGWTDGSTSALGTPVLSWTTGGSVGIGTDSPTYPFVVHGTQGDLNVKPSTIGGTLILEGTAPTLDINNEQTNGRVRLYGTNISFRNPTADPAMTITNGNVGIGTTAPAQKLEIEGSGGSPATTGITQGGLLRIGNNVQTTSIDMGLLSVPPYSGWIQVTQPTGLQSNFPLVLNPNGGTVGIGTDNPLTRLQVGNDLTIGEPIALGTSTPPQMMIFGPAVNSNNETSMLRLVRSTYSGNLYPSSADFKMSSYGTYGAPFLPKTQLTIGLKASGSYDSSDVVDVLTMRDNGNVGIGTSAPTSKLDVNGLLAVTGVNIPTTGAGVNIYYDGSNGGYIDSYNWSSSTRLPLEISGNPIKLTGGNVGIGTTSPSYPLQVGTAVSGISIYSLANVSASGYITRTDVFDKSQGNALDLIKDASAYKYLNGSVNHNAFTYSGVTYDKTIIDKITPTEKQIDNCTDVITKEATNESIAETQQVCNKIDIIENVTTYKTIKEQGVSLDKEVALLKQAIYELKVKNQNQEIEINKIKDCAKELDYKTYSECILKNG